MSLTRDHRRGAELLGTLDLKFAELVEELSGDAASPGLFLGAGLAGRATREGHVCLDLARAGELAGGDQDLPSPEVWAEELKASPAVGEPGAFTPLVLDEFNRLYLHRYWTYQDIVSRWIKQKVAETRHDLDPGELRRRVERLFPAPAEEDGVDRARVAACTAALKSFTVISGGPGTGKTTTVAGILALLAELPQDRPPRFVLAAPTGKAAARLGEAVRLTLERLPATDAAKASIPAAATTIHRLLGTIRGSSEFRRHPGSPLPVDVLVVDEASMVDIALMAALVRALQPEARLILLGDRDQLASVEAGAVLGDICGTDRPKGRTPRFRGLLEQASGQDLSSDEAGINPMSDSVVLLRKSHRFAEGSGIQEVSRALNQGDPDLTLELLGRRGFPDIAWYELPGTRDLYERLRAPAARGYEWCAGAGDPLGPVLERFSILCALREGPFGAKAVNLLVERALAEKGIITPEGRWYHGMPIMVSKNDYELQLFNGDMGVVIASSESGVGLQACFPMPDGTLRRFHPVRLPEHEAAYAMTVHKSQGSEFDRVLVLLPDRPSPVLTRELLYTAVTRARQYVEIWAPEDVLRSAVSRRTLRSSGLEQALWGGKNPGTHG
ncbi:MAG: exodeoxyribonuclease V subunit alpha [Desulfobacteraceae bacterium]